MQLPEETIKKIQQAFKKDVYEEIEISLKDRILYKIALWILFFQENVYKKKGTKIFYTQMIRFENDKETTLYRIGSLDNIKQTIDIINRLIPNKYNFKIQKVNFLKNMYYIIQRNIKDPKEEEEWKKSIEESIKQGTCIVIEIEDDDNSIKSFIKKLFFWII